MSEIIELIKLNKEETKDKEIIFGGSFDPIHQGHVNLIKNILEYFKKVIIAPTKQNPWKKRETLNLEFRINLIEKVLKDEGLISQVEILDIPYIYSKDLVSHLRSSNSNKSSECIYWASGGDSKESIENWKDFNELNLNVIIVPIEINIHSTEVREKSRKAHPSIIEEVESAY